MPNKLGTAFWLLAMIAIALPGFAINHVPTNQESQESFEGFMNGIRANAIKGEALYRRNDGKFALEPGLKLEDGDFIKTSVDAYAELLLQPGNYLRVGTETECQIISNQRDKMRLNLDRGTVSLEILTREKSFYSFVEVYELIRVITSNAEVFINEPGIFRINKTADGNTELIVRDGEASINGRRVKKKRRAVTSTEGVTITDIDLKIEDRFDVWGRERADQLVQVNKVLKKDSPWAKKQKEGKEMAVKFPDEEEQLSKSPMVVSVKPGAVNFVEAGVEFSRPLQDWQQLIEESQLEAGDRLRTSVNSFVELILFPDMYFRLGSSSEVLFEQLSNDAISLKLMKGAAILDVARFDRKQVPEITIAGPSTSAVIADQGNYRIDVRAEGDAITIREGKLSFSGRSIGACRRIVGQTISDCDDKKRTDNLDFWSQHRGEGELSDGRTSVSMVTYLAKWRRRLFRTTGFWYQPYGQTHYTFVPFTSELFSSPYGGRYSTVLTPRPMHLIIPGVQPTAPFPRRPIARPQRQPYP